MIYLVKNISHGKLTINCYNRIIGPGEVLEIESPTLPYEISSLISYHLVSVTEVNNTIAPEPKPTVNTDKKINKSNKY